MKPSELLKYLPKPNINEAKHGLNLIEVYRSYKNSPHNEEALYLKYLVHRLENGKKYHSASPEEQEAMDKAFLEHHQKGKAAEKNGFIRQNDLKSFIESPDTIKLARQLINHKEKLNNFILNEHPDHIVDINGEPHLRLTRALSVNREQRGEEHALASYADHSFPPFGGNTAIYHHQYVPLKNIWFTYDYGPKKASSEQYGPENEFIVSNHKIVYNENHETRGTWQILVRNHHSLDKVNRPEFASFYKNFKNLTKDELNEILSGKFKFDLKIHPDDLRHLIKVNTKTSMVHYYAAGNPNTHQDDLRWLIQNNKAGSYTHVRVAENRNTHPDDLSELIHKNEVGSAVHKSAAKNPQFKNLPPEIQQIVNPSGIEKIQKSFKQLTSEYERLTKADAPAVKLNPEHGRTIADAYHNMKHDPSHPEVKASYDALINETKQQYKDLLQQGYKFTRITDPDFRPYKNSKEMHADIENNKHLYYYPTSMGFGSEDSIPHDHPMLAPTEFTSHDGEQMAANDVFRQVHDINGHFLGGKTTFSPTGEHQSYLQHKKMYSNLAGKALATETMGQNSWVWAGPHGEHNRKNPANTIYAPQRAGLLPDEIINGKWHQ